MKKENKCELMKKKGKRKQFIDPSLQCYQKRVYILQNGQGNVTYQKLKWIKSNAGKQNGTFFQHTIALHFIKIILDEKNSSIRFPSNICKIKHCFKD